MRAPLSWLRDFAPFDQPVDRLTSALSDLGLVVDAVTTVGAPLDGVEVVQILRIRPHPNADRVRLVDVNRGDGQALQIVCGATNMAVGNLVALATLGATMPAGWEVTRRKMRGEWSNGMLCSAEELDLPAKGDLDGLLILATGLAEPGTALGDALGLVADVVFDLDITPNRPDALSMAGVARDLAAALGVPFAFPPDPTPAAVDASVDTARVVVADGDLCPRFTGTVIAGVEVGPSPAWLARRLTLAGMRPITNVVDVSNYVMLDVGQPNHAYDLDRLGGRGLRVRRAREGESLTTLDGVERALGRDDCLICDTESVPVGLGGIMGGTATEINAGTTTVMFEAAFFNPVAVARTGARLGLTSEARSRFERGIDPQIADRAIDRFTSLLAATQDSGTKMRRGPTTDVVSEHDLARPPTVLLRTARVNAVLGTTLTDSDVERLLRPIGFITTVADAGVHSVRIPSWRPDVDREIDVVEEVARLNGYANIARSVPKGARNGAGLTAFQRYRRHVRAVLVGAGLSEAWTTTFLAPGDLGRAGLAETAVEVANPLDRSESILRTALLPGLLKALKFNADRQADDVALFELGRTFAVPGPEQILPLEREELAVVISGPGVDATHAARLWTLLADAVRLAGVAVHADELAGLHPTRGARLVGADGDAVGELGEVDRRVVERFGLVGRVAFLRLDLKRLAAQPRRPGLVRGVSRFPASDIDLAFIVADPIPADRVEAAVRVAAGDLLEGVALFDIYRGPQIGPARRSLAYRLRFRAPERTLTDAEVAERRAGVIAAVTTAYGAELRG